MAVADKAGGWAEAQRRIAVCREMRSESVDLSGLRLTRVPEGLRELDWLRELNLNGNGIGDARALPRLENLTSLDLSHNNIGDEGVRAVSGLVNLTSLELAGTGLTNLSPLLKLEKLEHLDCSECKFVDAIPKLWELPSIKRVVLYRAILPSVPTEVLSRDKYLSCLESLRAHFADLKRGQSEIADFKLMLLGNGRVGKTQICRRLQGQEYDETVPSTHGVKIGAAPLTALRDHATLRIWDFGGQDIYHGTHALFLKSRAIFMLVWTPESETLHEHGYGAIFSQLQLPHSVSGLLETSEPMEFSATLSTNVAFPIMATL